MSRELKQLLIEKIANERFRSTYSNYATADEIALAILFADSNKVAKKDRDLALRLTKWSINKINMDLRGWIYYPRSRIYMALSAQKTKLEGAMFRYNLQQNRLAYAELGNHLIPELNVTVAQYYS